MLELGICLRYGEIIKSNSIEIKNIWWKNILI